MKKQLLCCIFAGVLTYSGITADAQVNISADGSTPENSAMLEVKSSNKGLLVPRMTQPQIAAIRNPANGLTVFCTTNEKIYVYKADESVWKELQYGSSVVTLPATYSIGTGGSCTNTVISAWPCQAVGFLGLDTVKIQATVTVPGTWNVTTDTVNGYSFHGTGIFPSAGLQTVKLIAYGTPQMLQTDHFTVSQSNGSGSCSFNITVTFCCGTILIDSRNGKTYSTVQIGSQCWMKQDLNIGTMISGSQKQTNNSIIEKYCYNDLAANCDIYGGLYQWDEMMVYTTAAGSQGICPSGWHVPTDGEWTVLTNLYGGEGLAGGHLKEAGTAHWASPNAADNTSGLTLLPGGSKVDVSVFSDQHAICRIWSSTQYSSTEAWRRGFTFNVIQLLRTTNVKSDFGFSVRCILN